MLENMLTEKNLLVNDKIKVREANEEESAEANEYLNAWCYRRRSKRTTLGKQFEILNMLLQRSGKEITQNP